MVRMKLMVNHGSWKLCVVVVRESIMMLILLIINNCESILILIINSQLIYHGIIVDPLQYSKGWTSTTPFATTPFHPHSKE